MDSEDWNCRIKRFWLRGVMSDYPMKFEGIGYAFKMFEHRFRTDGEKAGIWTGYERVPSRAC